jgi:hypothetical protein
VSRRCVISVGVPRLVPNQNKILVRDAKGNLVLGPPVPSPSTRWYPRGVQRLNDSLIAVGERAERLWWVNRLPPGAKPHADLPYGFKFAALAEVKRLGVDSVLWCDASCYALRSLDPIWKHIDEHGHLLVDCENYLSQWSTDRSLAALGFQREEMFCIPLVVGGVFGLRLSHPLGAQIFERMMALVTSDVLCGDWNNDRGQVSSDKRVRGHRHDQVLMGYIAHEMKLPLVKSPLFFNYLTPNPDASTLIVAHGMI